MFAGIDLAATPKGTTGICFLEKGEVFSSHFENEEIVEMVKEKNPKVIAIDSPLSFYGKSLRDCDRAIGKKWKILPLTFSPMRKLAERGMRLKDRLSSYAIIEVYPHASKMSLGIETTYAQKGYNMDFKNRHEFDAFICALTAKNYFLGKYVTYGKEDKIIVPL